MHRIAVTGIGVVAPGSVGKEQFWSNMREGQVFTGELTAFDKAGIRCPVSGEISDMLLDPYRCDIEKKLSGFCTEGISRVQFLALLGTKLAVEDSGLSAERIAAEAVHVAFGSTMGSEDSLFRREAPELLDNPTQELIDKYAPVNIIDAVLAYMGIDGEKYPARMFMNACAAGNYAIGDAFDEIRAGRCSVAVAGGVDALSYLAVAGFNRLLSVTPDLCRPFDKNRKGMVVSEGVGVLILEEMEHAKRRGAHIYAELSGWGMGVDGYHITTPHPEGNGAVQAMKRALDCAGITACDVDYISAHGTGTAANDSTEYRASRAIFGDNIPPMSSIKSMIGHTMGAASAIEAVACCMMLERQEILPTANFETADEMCPVDCVPRKGRNVQLLHVISNALAFGGNNSSVVFSSVKLKDGNFPANESAVDLFFRKEKKQTPEILFSHVMKRQEAKNWMQEHLPEADIRMADEQSVLVAAAIGRTIECLKASESVQGSGEWHLPKDATAIVTGSHCGALYPSFHFLRQTMIRGAIGASPMEFPNTVGNAPASRAAIWLGFKDKVASLSGSRLLSGLDAVLYALRLAKGDSCYAFACGIEEDSAVVVLVGPRS